MITLNPYKVNTEQLYQGLSGLHEAQNLRGLYATIGSDYVRKQPIPLQRDSYLDRVHLLPATATKSYTGIPKDQSPLGNLYTSSTALSSTVDDKIEGKNRLYN